MPRRSVIYIGIEMGGTKVVMAHGTEPDDLSAPVRLLTSGPEATLKSIIDYITKVRIHKPIKAPIKSIGIASFGPLGLDPQTKGYGIIQNTPKALWRHTDILAPIRAAHPDLPIGLDTDVNAAALGEQMWGGAEGLRDLIYVTVGTGVGVGIVVNSKPVHGLMHPEAGHIRVIRDPLDTYCGLCPFHGDCYEGLISGPALLARTGLSGEELAPDDAVFALVGRYLGQLLYTLTLSVSPQRILIGGGVGLNAKVLVTARDELHRLLAGYIEALAERDILDTYIAHASLGDRAGVLGAIVVASFAFDSEV
jgi:fructokinase